MNNKIITFSFDDGTIYDERLAEMLNKFGLKATFNINTGLIPNVHQNDHTDYLSFEKMHEVYKGHELGAHGYKHLWYGKNVTTEEAREDIEKDLAELKRIFPEFKVQGIAYPYGAFNDEIIKIVKDCGLKWGRGTNSNGKFEAKNLLAYDPTAHIRDTNLEQIIDEFLALKTDKVQILYIWGHSYEFRNFDLWDKFDSIFKKISNKKDIDYLTNSEAFERLMNSQN